eukprot:12289786-Alexandrium_andersonii.AAC.1
MLPSASDPAQQAVQQLFTPRRASPEQPRALNSPQANPSPPRRGCAFSSHPCRAACCSSR